MNLKQKLSRKMKKTGGFTLIEMLIVVAIIAILIAISIPMINSSLEKARNATDDANERAAKGAALASYMLAETTSEDGTSEYADKFTDNGTTAVCYYNAESGEVQKDTTGIEGYNQAKQTGDRGEDCVEVTITIDDGSTKTAWKTISGS